MQKRSADDALPRMFLALLFPASLAGCAVGPDFEAPVAPAVERFTPEKTISPGNGQQFHEGAEVPGRWWMAFRSKPLNDLVEEAISHSPTLEAAEAAIRVARYDADAAKGALLPQASLNSSSNYTLASGDSTSTSVTQQAYSFFTKQLQISYAPDIWGANRRAVESLEARREIQSWQKQAAYLTLAANVAEAAIEEASLRGQIAATRRIIVLEEERSALLERQFAYGAAAKTDILSQQSALARARQTLPPLESRLAQQRNLLAALTGRYPSQAIAETFELSELTLPRNLPVSLPSRLVAQRPDIKAAEASVHSASAQIGVAVAARLPNVLLTANGGASAFTLAQLFTPGAGFYTLAGTVAQPVFDGMTLLNKQRAAEAELAQAEARYRAAVVNAFQNVADCLRALQGDARAVREARIAEAVSRKLLDKIRSQQRYGAVSQLAAVDAQRFYLDASISRIQTDALRLVDTVALYMALGGGEKSSFW
ncbi:Outer+membrane+protein+OprM [Methylocapsa aurea]|uniref:efflux transporter outer membrane subunit n=1 Tax=Methylocapsa aurea TaxID=663610 RepID=UPI003D18C79A